MRRHGVVLQLDTLYPRICELEGLRISTFYKEKMMQDVLEDANINTNLSSHYHRAAQTKLSNINGRLQQSSPYSFQTQPILRYSVLPATQLHIRNTTIIAIMTSRLNSFLRSDIIHRFVCFVLGIISVSFAAILRYQYDKEAYKVPFTLVC